MAAVDTGSDVYMVFANPYLVLEHYADEMRKLNLVPPMTVEASVFIHKRRLAFYGLRSGNLTPASLAAFAFAVLPCLLLIGRV